jgi:hypothetical protein
MEKKAKSATENSAGKDTIKSKSTAANAKLPKKKNSDEPKTYGKSGKAGG